MIEAVQASAPIGHRRALERDMAFVTSAWLESFRVSHYAGVLPFREWYEAHRLFLGQLLERPGVEVWVAYNPEESDPRFDIYGFLVVQWTDTVPVLLYSYTKQAFRRLGIAKSLFAKAGLGRRDRFWYPFRTECGQDVIRACSLNASYDPYLARGRKAKEKDL